MIANLKELAKDKKCMVIGELNDDFHTLFQEYTNYQFNKEVITHIIHNNLIDEMNLIVINNETDEEIKQELITPKTIIISKNINPLFNKALTILPPYEKYDFYLKICMILSLEKFTTLFQKKDNILSHKIDDKTFDTFLDDYSGSIIFENDELEIIISKLKKFELNQTLIQELSKNLSHIAYIYSKHNSIKSVSYVFQNLSKFLDELQLEELPPTSFEFFDYLTNILEDIYTYNNELFVFKIFKDTYIFEHSLQNNIEYFKSSLLNKNITSDEDDLEFFND
jgi:hypothetical protein